MTQIEGRPTWNQRDHAERLDYIDAMDQLEAELEADQLELERKLKLAGNVIIGILGIALVVVLASLGR